MKSLSILLVLLLLCSPLYSEETFLLQLEKELNLLEIAWEKSQTQLSVQKEQVKTLESQCQTLKEQLKQQNTLLMESEKLTTKLKEQVKMSESLSVELENSLKRKERELVNHKVINGLLITLLGGFLVYQVVSTS